MTTVKSDKLTFKKRIIAFYLFTLVPFIIHLIYRKSFALDFSEAVFNFTLLLWFLTIGSIFWFLFGIFSYFRNYLNKKIATLLFIIGSVLCIIILFLYTISWVIYLTGGYFVNLSIIFTIIKSLPASVELLLPSEVFVGIVLFCYSIVVYYLLIKLLDNKYDFSKLKRICVATFILVLMFWSGAQVFPNFYYKYYNKNNLKLFGYIQQLFSSDPLLYLFEPFFTDLNFKFKLKNTPIISLEEYIRSVPESKIKKYNIVILFIESFRADALKPFHSQQVVMPFLYKLTSSSLVFSRYFSQSNNSIEASTSFLASLFPYRFRTADDYMDIKYPRTLIYDLLKKLGYKTSIFSSQDEQFLNHYRFIKTDSLDVFFHAGNVPERKFKMFEANWAILDDKFTVNEFGKWVKSISADKPIFTYMNLQTTHFPYQYAKNIKEIFTPCKFGRYRGSFIYYAKSLLNIMQNRYKNSLHYIDERIKEVVEILKESNRLSRTILVIVGDHGEAFYEHENVTHAKDLFNECINVPLIIYSPGLLKPGVYPYNIQGVDVFPTILSLMGLPRYPGFQGVDIFSLKKPENHTLFISTYYFRDIACIIKGNYKFILDTITGNKLFNLELDFNEKVNFVRRKKELAETLFFELLAYKYKQLRYYSDERNFRYFPPAYY